MRYNNGATDNYDSNHIQGYNNGTNYWGHKGRGNYWSDWTTPDNNHDGIVDNPYALDGDGAQDNYPLVNPTVPEFATSIIIILWIIATAGIFLYRKL